MKPKKPIQKTSPSNDHQPNTGSDARSGMTATTIKPQRSLRSLLTLWFLVFAIAPLAFITGYSMVQFERAIDDELFKRLHGNSREIGVVFNDLENYLANYGSIHASDSSLSYYMSTSSYANARRLLQGWLRNYSATRISLFDADGKLVVALSRDANGEPKNLSQLETGEIYLRESLLNQLKEKQQAKFRDFAKTSGVFDIIVYNRIVDKKSRAVGYLEEIISIDQAYLDGMRKRLNLEIFLLDKEARVRVSTEDDYMAYPKNFFQEKLEGGRSTFFEIINRGAPYGVKIQPLSESEDSALLGLAASKRDVTSALKGINKALFSVVGFIILLLVITLFATSRLFLKPLYHLVEAAQKISAGKYGTQIEIESDTEIGLLTQSFNVMSTKVAEAKNSLDSKINELERLNADLQETQAQLVHSAKMVSLGQLVAGVAHELNNPIGFIYSNMTHLKDYSEKLGKLVQIAESSPSEIKSVKKEIEYDYIIEDMPRLISSCEDGARRVRDIVISLRNFSRIDESQIKSIDLNEAIDDTLQLLSGELKNRIVVHKNYGILPHIKCFASQINQVFMNILSNAAQAIEDRGEIWISTAADTQSIEIKIKDSGSGINEKTIEKIFDPFFTTKPVGKGTGLGLSISYGIVKRHGGEIKVSSEINKGTEFSIILPIDHPLLGEAATDRASQ